MQPQTIHLLNQLNHQFYQTTANSFDASRSAPWEGWKHLLPYLQDASKRPLWQLLDVGCGNGRFGAFWGDEVGFPCHYTGLDIEPYLLERAEETLSTKNISHQLIRHDVVANGLPFDENYDLITLFGVMHHVPSFEGRKNLIEQIKKQLKPQGLLILTFWRFYDLDRFRRRIVPWESDLVPSEYHGLDLETNDYLLDWRQGENALRYCHYVDEAEQAQLLADCSILGEFTADTCNRYVLLEV